MTEPKTLDEERSPSRTRRLDDNYGLVLVAILASMVILAVLSERDAARPLSLLVFAAIFFLTLLASGISRRKILMWTVLAPIILIVAGFTGAYRSRPDAIAISMFVSILLAGGCAVVIARRLASHPRISLRTVLGALCIYLFIALLFAMVYRVIGVVSDAPFFAQDTEVTGLDYIYFSFVCITTLGFGDLSPATELGKMVAVIEAVIGQLYLVTVVALFVGHLGFKRGRNDESPEDLLAEKGRNQGPQ